MQVGDREVAVFDLAHTLTLEELSVVKEAIIKAVIESVMQPKDKIDQFISQEVKVDLEFTLKGAWNCIVGERFGASVNVEDNKYGQFFVDEKYNIFVFKNPTLKSK